MNKKNFSLIGKWANDRRFINDETTQLIEFNFLSTKNVTLKFSVGGMFHHTYSVEQKSEYYILRLADQKTGESSIAVILFKIIDVDTLKVQVIDRDDPLEWNKKEPEIDTGILRRQAVV